MICYIESPLRGQSNVNGHEVVIIALGSNTGSTYRYAIVIDEDGSLLELGIGDLKVNWRFDDRKRTWFDVDTGEELGDDNDDGGT